MNKAVLIGIGAAVLLMNMSGCARKTPYEYFYEGRFLEAKRAYEPILAKNSDNVNTTLYSLCYGLSAYEGGDYHCADECFARCVHKMESIEAKGEVMAVVGSEYSKEYKGDPYEKSMAHIYCGLSHMRQKNYEDALVAFRRSLVADQDTRTKDEDKTKDFALGHYFAGVCYTFLNEPYNAQVQFDQAGKYSVASDIYSKEHTEQSNTFFLIGCGNGPFKYPHGPGYSLIDFRKAADPVSRIELLCDGQELGPAIFTDDLLVEAESHGWGEMDSARLAKGIAKEIVSRIPLVGIASALIQSQADARAWILLPGNTYVWAGKIEPGLHTIAMRCSDAKGNPLPQYDQVWFNMPISTESPNVYNFRMIPYRQDIKEKVLVPCSVLREQD